MKTPSITFMLRNLREGESFITTAPDKQVSSASTHTGVKITTENIDILSCKKSIAEQTVRKVVLVTIIDKSNLIPKSKVGRKPKRETSKESKGDVVNPCTCGSNSDHSEDHEVSCPAFVPF